MLLSQAILLTAIGVFANDGIGNSSNNTYYKNFDTGFFLNSHDKGPASRIILHGSLVSFNAASGKNFFALSWNTVAASPCDHFEVERSLDGQKFEKMGEVKGYSNTASEDLYSFQDNFRPITARKNDFYYRLKQVDVNGQVSYSKILIARMYNTKSLASLSITPDPAINDILVNVQLKEDAYVVMKISDKEGNQVIKKTSKAEYGLNTFTLDGTNKLSAGSYKLEVIVNSNERLEMQLEKS